MQAVDTEAAVGTNKSVGQRKQGTLVIDQRNLTQTNNNCIDRLPSWVNIFKRNSDECLFM